MSEDRFRELLGPYVLGELSADEERELERHLRECPECRDELEGVRHAHDLLSESVSVKPPPELKEWVLARARSEVPSRPGSRWRLWAPAVAVWLVAAVLGVWVFQAVISSPSEGVPLSSTELAPKAGGEVRGERVGQNFRVELEVWGLPELKKGEYYEMWYYKDDGGRISCGTFRAQPDGHTTVNLMAPISATNYPEIEVTLEPGDGDPRASGKEVLKGSLKDL